jgi:TonB family protein
MLVTVSELAFVLAIAISALSAQEQGYLPAQLQNGRAPSIPVTAVGGGEVLVELDVSAEGSVTRATPLRTTPPFTDLVLSAVRDWRFFPARDVADSERARAGEPISRVAVPSTVLVAAVFRPPSIRTPTLGEPPQDVANASMAVPWPEKLISPVYPPRALGSGTVLLEVHVSATGSVDDVGVIATTPPFDEPAKEAIRKWHFRPAQIHGAPVRALVYAICGFRTPVQ